MTNDISLNTVIISAAIGIGTWALKSGITELVKALVKNYVKMISLEAQIEKVVGIVESVPKIKADVDISFQRIRKLEDQNKSIDL